MCMPVPMAMHSAVKVLATWLLRSWIQIPFRAWMFVPCLYTLFHAEALRQAVYLSKESCNVYVRNECVMEKRTGPYSNWCKSVK